MSSPSTTKSPASIPPTPKRPGMRSLASTRVPYRTSPPLSRPTTLMTRRGRRRRMMGSSRHQSRDTGRLLLQSHRLCPSLGPRPSSSHRQIRPPRRLSGGRRSVRRRRSARPQQKSERAESCTGHHLARRRESLTRVARRVSDLPPFFMKTWLPETRHSLTVTVLAIESRVARIKARVAELTNNMEGAQGPGPIRSTVPR